MSIGITHNAVDNNSRRNAYLYYIFVLCMYKYLSIKYNAVNDASAQPTERTFL